MTESFLSVLKVIVFFQFTFIMKRLYSLLILMPVYIGCIQAQRDFREGYIITNRQDTIYGWIDYRGDVRNAKICSFRETEAGQTTDYTPSDIVAYRFTDSKFYVSKDIGSADAPKLVFLEYLVNGLAKLYYYRDDNTSDIYFIEKEGQFHELKIDKKEIEVDRKTGIKTVKSYIGVLKATLNVWEMSNEIDKADLNHSSLVNIAKNYHQYVCTDGSECIVYEKKKPFMAIRIGPVVGADLSVFKLKMDLGYEDDVHKCNPLPSTKLSVGLNLNFWIPQLNEKLFLYGQAMYSKYYFFDAYESSQRATDSHIRSNVMRIGLGIKYEYPKGKWRPTLSTGAAIVWMPDGNIKEITDTYTYEVIRHSTVNYKFPTKFMNGFEIVPGVHYYIAKERIIFLQVQYLQCYNRREFNYISKVFQSFRLSERSIGLSAGIYF